MFVTFEGPEGAGKSTVLEAIAERFEKVGRNVVRTREPGAGDLGVGIRELLLHGGDMPSESELFLFLADRANHVRRVILPALAEGKIVLCDRYADSTLVYQAFARGLDEEFVRKANRFATGGLLPDRTLLLDLDPSIGLSRLRSKDRLDAQPLQFHRAVREGFLREAAANSERWLVVDASRSPEEVAEAAWRALGVGG